MRWQDYQCKVGVGMTQWRVAIWYVWFKRKRSCLTSLSSQSPTKLECGNVCLCCPPNATFYYVHWMAWYIWIISTDHLPFARLCDHGSSWGCRVTTLFLLYNWQPCSNEEKNAHNHLFPHSRTLSHLDISSTCGCWNSRPGYSSSASISTFWWGTVHKLHGH